MTKNQSRVYLIGFMGAGKTSLGKELALKFKFNFLDLDEVIENETGEELTDIFSRSEDEFRKIEADTLRSLTFSNTVFSLGGGTPCFYDNMDFIKQAGISVYIQVSEEELFNRLKFHRQIRPLIMDKDEEELKEYIHDLLSEREKFYEAS